MSDLDEKILKELQLTNRLLAQMLIKDAANQTVRIALLERCGFAPSEIAGLLRIKDNIVTATLSKARKTASKKQ